MQASPTIRRSTIQFSPNIPYDLVLKYATGRECSNGSIMFSTYDDEVFFLRPEDAHKIHALGLSQNERFRLIKRVVGAGRSAETTIVVSRIDESGRPVSNLGGSGPAAAVATTDIQHAQSQPPQPKSTGLSSILASSYIAAVDALILAEQYAKSKGVTLRITEEEIRTSAHCIFIQYFREKEFNAKFGGAK